MKEICDLDIFRQCRLCGVNGHHEMDILDNDLNVESHNPNALSAKIFRSVGIRVERGDKITTRICGNCVGKVDEIVVFRKVCAATDIQLRNAVLNDSEELIAAALDDLDEVQEITTPTQMVCIANPSSRAERAETMQRKIAEMDSSDSEMGQRDVLFVSQTSVARPCSVYLNRIDHTGNANAEYSEMEASPLCHGERARSTLNPRHWSVGQSGSIGRQFSEGAPETNCNRSNTPVAYVSSSENESDVEEFDVKIRLFPERSRNVSKKKCAKLSGKAAQKRNSGRFTVKCCGRQCRELFESWDAMMYHATHYHAKGETNKFQCHMCRGEFRNKRNLIVHMNSVHSRRTRFQCPVRACSKVFTRKSYLTVHINAFHTKRIAFKCSKCPKIFYSKNYLKGHLASKHGEGIQYYCYLCHKRCATKQSLRLHTNLNHTGQSLFTCPKSTCSTVCASKAHLKQHMNVVHTKAVVYKCTICAWKGYYKSSLKVHLAQKHGE